MQDLFGSLEATPISSGFCLGSCNWVLENDQIKVSHTPSHKPPHPHTSLHTLTQASTRPHTSLHTLTQTSTPSQVSYISSSSTFTTHPCSMERSKPLTSDVMILCGLTNAPVANPDSMLSELCGRMGTSDQPLLVC